KDEATALRDDVKVLNARIVNWKLDKAGVKRWGENSEANYAAYADFMLKYGIIKDKISAKDLITNDLIDAINRFDASKVAAEAMAHGYAMVTGRPQAVMVHVIVGAANALAGIINASRVGVPMLFTAGRNPITEAGLPGARNRPIHWAQESFDQAGLAREFVKWDYELRNFLQLETVVDRALAIASAEPQGPVYLTLPREVLSEAQESFEYSATSRAPK